MSGTIALVDYGMGNIHSVVKQFRNSGADVLVTSTPTELAAADKIILPGVGHFGKAMDMLRNRHLLDVLNEAALDKKKPVLGICLGMQLMCKNSEEGDSEGLGWFDSTVHKFDFEDALNYKVPHIGWNSISLEKDAPIMKGIEQKALFYFVHSYYAKASGKDVLNKTNYNTDFVSALSKENIFGVQYHPEKSHDVGQQLIKNFINL